jgi:uncharacterized protein (TIGR00297 family)
MDIAIIAGIVLICILSAHLRFLTILGSAAAFLTGFTIYLSFHWKGLIVLGVFFMTSSFLTKWKKDRKRDEKASHHQEVMGRTAGQVFANGGAAVCAAVMNQITEHPIWLIIFLCSFAAATADTWASEIGVLSKAKPFHLKERKKVERGLSGAVSPLGTFAALLGAVMIAGCYYVLYHTVSFVIVFIIIFAGFIGNIADTIFGAWFEQKFFCSICRIETEATMHCGVKTTKVFGYSWITNNKVNFFSTIIGGCIGGGLYIWLVL